MRDAVTLEDMKLPVIAAITEEFTVHSENIARMEGHAALRRLILPYPLEGLSDAELDEIADAFYPAMLQGLGVQA